MKENNNKPGVVDIRLFNRNKMNIIVKHNGGILALLCPECRTIIKTGAHFTKEEMDAACGRKVMEAYLCEKCKNKENGEDILDKNTEKL